MMRVGMRTALPDGRAYQVFRETSCDRGPAVRPITLGDMPPNPASSGMLHVCNA
jgi:hypothetical protein